MLIMMSLNLVFVVICKKFAELKFRYVEEERPEEFFIPYVWSLVYHASNLYFNPTHVQLFSVQTMTVSV